MSQERLGCNKAKPPWVGSRYCEASEQQAYR
jgi:hypothetical protein